MSHLDLLQRFPLKKENSMKELDSEVAGGSEDSQQIQSKSEKMSCLVAKAQTQER